MKSILLVEDSRFLRRANERTLAKAGYRVTSAADGEEAAQLARTTTPDLVLLDMLLPKLGGPEVLRTLRNDPATANIPIVVLSSLPQINEQKLKGEGATAYFEKSRLDLDNDSEALLQIVAETLDRESVNTRKNLHLERRPNMTPEMEFECLLVSRDPALYSTINKVLRKFSICVDHCLSSVKACDAVAQGKHDLVVIDWDGPASSELVHKVWSLREKKKPTVLAISENGAPIPGAHVTLRKPITLDSGIKSLKIAYSRMLLDYRLHSRHAIMVRVVVRDENGQCFPATVTDIGDGGIGLSAKSKFAVGNVLSFSMQLPQTGSPLHIQAGVLWTREYGTAGCEIRSIPPIDRDVLRDWLKSKIRIKKPSISVSTQGTQ